MFHVHYITPRYFALTGRQNGDIASGIIVLTQKWDTWYNEGQGFHENEFASLDIRGMKCGKSRFG